LGVADFIRVPSPAARITTAAGGSSGGTVAYLLSAMGTTVEPTGPCRTCL
jgi:hypothetical protein